MNEQSTRGSDHGDPSRDDRGDGPPASAVLIGLLLIGLACVAGYFLLMKLVAMSREDDCLLAHRKDCAAIEVPANR